MCLRWIVLQQSIPDVKLQLITKLTKFSAMHDADSLNLPSWTFQHQQAIFFPSFQPCSQCIYVDGFREPRPQVRLNVYETYPDTCTGITPSCSGFWISNSVTPLDLLHCLAESVSPTPLRIWEFLSNSNLNPGTNRTDWRWPCRRWRWLIYIYCTCRADGLFFLGFLLLISLFLMASKI